MELLLQVRSRHVRLLKEQVAFIEVVSDVIYIYIYIYIYNNNNIGIFQNSIMLSNRCKYVHVYIAYIIFFIAIKITYRGKGGYFFKTS